jgi:flagellar hook assembly protein FlgD
VGAYSYKVTAVDLNGNESAPAALGNVVGTDGNVPPDRLFLHHAVPNPMRGSVAMAVDLPRTGRVQLAVYDARGALVRGLVDDTREAGRFVAVWPGRDDGGRAVRPGVYYVRLTALGETQVRKVLVVE